MKSAADATMIVSEHMKIILLRSSSLTIAPHDAKDFSAQCCACIRRAIHKLSTGTQELFLPFL